MSTTTIPTSGNTAPEYVAIRGTFERLTILFNMDPENIAVRLFQAGLIPKLPGKDIDTTALVRSTLACVEHDAIMFYKFLGVLKTFGAGGKAELESIDKKFVGK